MCDQIAGAPADAQEAPKRCVMEKGKEEKLDGGFWDRADSFIDLANSYCENVETGKVSASLLYAAARFNASLVAGSAGSVNELKGDKEKAIAYFSEQYKKMLGENLQDYIENYEQYMSS
jgi:hypothetical protein